MRQTALILVLALVLVACDQKDLPVDSPSTAPNTTATATRPTLASLSPPVHRIAQPASLRTLRLTDDAVGTITAPNTPKRTLNGLGVAACQTGWVIQGMYFNDDGVLVTTNPFSIGLSEIPVGKKVRYVDPNVADRALLLDFSSFDYERVAGSFTVVDTSDNDAKMLQLEVDGRPTSLAQATGLGPMGCFDTGYWKAKSGETEVYGPVTAVYDPANLHWVGARLTPTINLVFLFTLKPAERGQGDLITTTIAKIKEQPDLIPIRVYLERRVDKSDYDRTTGPQTKLEEFPLAAGKLFASFPTGDVGGPMRIQLENAEFPEWDGPLSGAKIELLRLEALFVTDTDGEEVPLPTPPEWFKRAPVVLP